ncbi:MAG TPA: HAD-IIB family hydrolase [Acidobacteriota bacterium]|nr:HAD-IIB family hydrolase [Acidobacteriota bacterium]
MLLARHLIFTDLDGTLLNSRTYSWAGAEPALNEIERRRIPLILVTSKTRAELEPLRRKLGHAHPFITENGGGVFIPDGYFNLKIPGAERHTRYLCLPLARPYREALAALEEISKAAGVSVVGFHDMTPREIAQNTGLGPRDAELAKQRDFDEPFFIAGASEESIRAFRQEAAEKKVSLSFGGRFWHISIGSDKGRAVRELVKLYQAGLRARLTTIGLGDAPSDLPLLRAVKEPVVLPDPQGAFDEEVLKALPKIHRADRPGPAGWSDAVLALIAAPPRAQVT